MSAHSTPSDLHGQRIGVLGAARSGLAAAIALKRRGVAVFLSEANHIPPSTKAQLKTLDIPFEEGGHSERGLRSNGLVISPGIPWSHPLLEAARAHRIPVWGELELGYRLCPSRKLIAVTGTNGKSTATRLIGALLHARGHAVAVGGNLGTPLCAMLDEIDPDTWVVLEVSSFQLEGALSFAPHIGVWLNLTPDHLDRHGCMQTYRNLKLRLFHRQGRHDHAVLGPGLTLPTSYAGHVHRFEPWVALAPRALPDHQRRNLAASLCAAQLADPLCALEGLDLPTLLSQPHCLEHVGAVRGVSFYNDSKATNPHAALAALETLKAQGPLCVLLGGCPKGADPAPLARYIAGQAHVAQALLVGPLAAHWRKALLEAGFGRFRTVGSLEEALGALDAQVRTCVLAPAGSSFDLYADYRARGEAFRSAVQALSKSSATALTT